MVADSHCLAWRQLHAGGRQQSREARVEIMPFWPPLVMYCLIPWLSWVSCTSLRHKELFESWTLTCTPGTY